MAASALVLVEAPAFVVILLLLAAIIRGRQLSCLALDFRLVCLPVSGLDRCRLLLVLVVCPSETADIIHVDVILESTALAGVSWTCRRRRLGILKGPHLPP